MIVTCRTLMCWSSGDHSSPMTVRPIHFFGKTGKFVVLKLEILNHRLHRVEDRLGVAHPPCSERCAGTGLCSCWCARFSLSSNFCITVRSWIVVCPGQNWQYSGVETKCAIRCLSRTAPDLGCGWHYPTSHSTESLNTHTSDCNCSEIGCWSNEHVLQGLPVQSTCSVSFWRPLGHCPSSRFN